MSARADADIPRLRLRVVDLGGRTPNPRLTNCWVDEFPVKPITAEVHKMIAHCVRICAWVRVRLRAYMYARVSACVRTRYFCAVLAVALLLYH